MSSPQNGNNLTYQNSASDPCFAGKPLENDKFLKTTKQIIRSQSQW